VNTDGGVLVEDRPGSALELEGCQLWLAGGPPLYAAVEDPAVTRVGVETFRGTLEGSSVLSS